MKVGRNLSEADIASWQKSSKKDIGKLIDEIVDCPEIRSPIVVY